MSTLLRVRDLQVSFPGKPAVHAVNGLNVELEAGETLAIVGESGSGKSVTAMAIAGLLPREATIGAGQVLLDDRDLLRASAREMRRIRGNQIGVIFQDPMSSLNPIRTIGDQVGEIITAHRRISRGALRSRVVELLELVGVPAADSRYDRYPFEFSGGMLQRAIIAMAMANAPRLIIADEPTTALDVTIQAQVLRVLHRAKEETGAATIFITHDLAVVAEVADRVCVMYGGRIVETAPVQDIFDRPSHPYTRALLRSLPRMDSEATRLLPLAGTPPVFDAPPRGCTFVDRCTLSQGRAECTDQVPEAMPVGNGDHTTACHFWNELPALTERSEVS